MATTLLTGAALAPHFDTRTALVLIAAGTVVGSALVASLAPIGPRLGAPSIIATRAALGRPGASALALLLYVTNFAWIALNNVIAASVLARTLGGDERAWSVVMGVLATAVVAAGPRAVGRADRVAVPLMAVAGLVFLWRCAMLPAGALHPAGSPAPAPTLGLLRGFDVVVAYQVSWILMFADYSRFTASPRGAAVATFAGLAVTSAWFMPLGLIAGRAAGRADPGAMVEAVGAGVAGGVLLALGTLTTNFVNIYLSGLAWKSLLPAASPALTVWTIGAIGTGLGLLSRVWLDRFADLMLVLGGILVPVGGILLARFFALPLPVVADLYGPEPAPRRSVAAGAAAWAAGAAVYFVAGTWGGTLPSLVTSALAYRVLAGRDPGGGGRS